MTDEERIAMEKIQAEAIPDPVACNRAMSGQDQRIAELKAQVCRMREALEEIINECMLNLDCNHSVSVVDEEPDEEVCGDIDDCVGCTIVAHAKAVLASTAPCPHTARLVEIQSYQCSLRGTIEALHADGEISEASRGHLIDALKMDQPCRHAAEIERLKKLCARGAHASCMKCAVSVELLEAAEGRKQ